MENQRATYKEISNAFCPRCGNFSNFCSENARPHTLYRCQSCGSSTLTYEDIQEENPEETIRAIGRN